jgi:hypothetical protein
VGRLPGARTDVADVAEIVDAVSAQIAGAWREG